MVDTLQFLQKKPGMSSPSLHKYKSFNCALLCLEELMRELKGLQSLSANTVLQFTIHVPTSASEASWFDSV